MTAKWTPYTRLSRMPPSPLNQPTHHVVLAIHCSLLSFALTLAMTDQKMDARVPSDTSKTGPHTKGDNEKPVAHARRFVEECFARGLQYGDAVTM